MLTEVQIQTWGFFTQWLKSTSVSNLRSLHKLITGRNELGSDIICLWRASTLREQSDFGSPQLEDEDETEHPSNIFSEDQESNLVPIFRVCFNHFKIPLWPTRGGRAFSAMLDEQCAAEGGFSSS